MVLSLHRPPAPRITLLFAIVLMAVGLSACGKKLDPRQVVGTLERDRVELIAEVSEPIVAVYVHEGDDVVVGQAIALLDTTALEAQYLQLVAARTRSEARLAELERGPRSERIAEARARLAGADAALADADRDVARYGALAAEGASPTARLDAAVTARDGARARRDESSATLSALTNGTTDEELAQASATVREAQQAIAGIEVHAARLTIRATRSGIVDALPFDVGDRPPAGGTIAVLVTDGAPYARVFIPETIRVHVQPGTEASIMADGLSSPLRGRVRRISQDPAFTPYNALTEQDRGHLSYLAEIAIEDAASQPGSGPRTLPAGLPVQVTLEIPAP